MTDLLALAHALLPAARAAGDLEMKYFREDVGVTRKSDGSPVTEADRAAEKLIRVALAEHAPGIPVVGEEGVADGDIPDVSGGRFFLVDALDGTREFITGGGDFTVNIALLEGFRPVMGIILAPMSGMLYYAAQGRAFKGEGEEIRTRPAPPEGLTVVASRRSDSSRIQDFLQGQRVHTTVTRSSSLKFCVIAEGEADIYPRLGPTSEWDTAAGEAILAAAGGTVTDTAGRPLVYGKPEKRFLNPEFVARGAG